MSVANLSNIVLALEAQSGLGVAASGAGATGMEVRASSGLDLAVASIESQMIQRNRMRKRARQGSHQASAQYETELCVGNMDTVMQAVLGGTWVAATNYSNADWGTCTITGTGVTITFGAGTLLTDGVRAGMFVRFSNLSVSANNALYVPILEVSETIMIVAAGILIDNASDAAWTAVIARHIYTPTTYVDRYFTVEEYLTDIDRSKVGTDMKLNSLNFGISPDQVISTGFGLVGRDMNVLASGASPTFTSPTYVDNPSLVLLDGAMYVNGTARANITGCTFGLSGPAQTIPVVGSAISPDVLLGQFSLAGSFSVAVEDATDFDLFDAETQISVLLHCCEQGGEGTDFVGIYMGNLAYGGYRTGIGGEGGVIATLPLYGGADERGTGYAETSLLISTSAA